MKARRKQFTIGSLMILIAVVAVILAIPELPLILGVGLLVFLAVPVFLLFFLLFLAIPLTLLDWLERRDLAELSLGSLDEPEREPVS
jgi:hypothetical protein